MLTKNYYQGYIGAWSGRLAFAGGIEKMSLYNMLFGENIHADALLDILQLEKESISRYRDCLYCDGRILLYTRTGGHKAKEHTHFNESMTEHPCFFSWEDDDPEGDTYRSFYFASTIPIPSSWLYAHPKLKWDDYMMRAKNGGPFTLREEKAMEESAKKIREAYNSGNRVVFIEL